MLHLLKFIGLWLCRIFFSVEFHGVENVPANGAVIIAGNHPSYLDPVLITIPLKRRIRFMAWDALFKIPLLGWLIRALGAFPVDLRKGKGESAFREAVKILSSREVLGIFPEGQRSEKGPMGELKTGVARLAIETGATIIPVTIAGASRAWPKWKLLPKPAKIIVRFHPPITLDAESAIARREDRMYHTEVMQQVAAQINRSLEPALRGAQHFERWYRQPPSHLRTYEYAPLIAAIVVSFLLLNRGAALSAWLVAWIPAVIYYLYLITDLTIIPPSRFSKWLRNSMPVWLIFAWHYWLCGVAQLPVGKFNGILAAAVLVSFFLYFYEDYLTMQKFVRGLCTLYYFSMLLLLRWPDELALYVAGLVFIAIFSVWYKVIYARVTVVVMTVCLLCGIWMQGSFSRLLSIYILLALAVILYLQTFITAAYDIRRAGELT
jgi:1-acyl-sn-glycerol-3-phosphate acyltransferase